MSQLPLRLAPEQQSQQWKSLLDPVLANPLNNILILPNIRLIAGTNVINHLLQRNQQGWIITDIQGAAQIYRSEPFNNLTLTLVSDAPVTCNIGVY